MAWTNSLLLPPEPHVVELLAAASQNQSIASIMANNFDDPRAFAPWWFDADQAQAFLASKTQQKSLKGKTAKGELKWTQLKL